MMFSERPRPEPVRVDQTFPEAGRGSMWVRHEVVDPETGLVLASAWVWAYGRVGALAGAEGLAAAARAQLPNAILAAVRDELEQGCLKALRQEWHEAKLPPARKGR